MVNRSKDKGTAAESAVAEYLRNHGWPWAERRALHGATDKGDITGTPGIIWEVKAGRDMRMAEWMQETVAERANANAEHGVLVIKPVGVGDTRVGDWLAAMIGWDLDRLTMALPEPGRVYLRHHFFNQADLRNQVISAHRSRPEGHFVMTSIRPRGKRNAPQEWYNVTTLAELVDMLRAGGFGTPLDLAP